jgi:hypothetical protein
MEKMWPLMLLNLGLVVLGTWWSSVPSIIVTRDSSIKTRHHFDRIPIKRLNFDSIPEGFPLPPRIIPRMDQVGFCFP